MWQFAIDTDIIKIQNPLRSNKNAVMRLQAMSRSSGGEVYVYNKGLRRQKLTAEWNELRQSEHDDLQDFFDNVADGMITPFLLVDHEGNSWLARFLDSTLDWTQVDDQSSGSSTFCAAACETGPEPAYPTTTRTKAVWGITLNLEVGPALS